MAFNQNDADLRFSASLQDNVSPTADKIAAKLRELGASKHEIKVFLRAYDEASAKAAQVQENLRRLPKEAKIKITADTQQVKQKLDALKEDAKKPVEFTVHVKHNVDNMISDMRSKLQNFKAEASGFFVNMPAVNAARAYGPQVAGPAINSATNALGVGGIGMGVGAVGALAYMGHQTMQINSEMEQSFMTLNQTMKDSAQARKEMLSLIDLAKKTPFNYQDVLQADVRYRSYGINPQGTVGVKQAGDMAAAMNTALSEAVEAIADARQGYFRRMETYGVRMTQEDFAPGGKYQGMTYEQGVAQAMKRFEGSMEVQARTFQGIVSNLQDIVQQNITRPIGTGLFETVRSRADSFQAKMNDPQFQKELGQAIEKVQLGFYKLYGVIQQGKDYFETYLLAPLKQIAENAMNLGRVFAEAFGGTTVTMLKYAFEGFNALIEPISTLAAKFPVVAQAFGIIKGLQFTGFGALAEPFDQLLKSLNPLSPSITGFVKSLANITLHIPLYALVAISKAFLDMNTAAKAVTEQVTLMGDKGQTAIDKLQIKLDAISGSFDQSAATAQRFAAAIAKIEPPSAMDQLQPERYTKWLEGATKQALQTREQFGEQAAQLYLKELSGMGRNATGAGVNTRSSILALKSSMGVGNEEAVKLLGQSYQAFEPELRKRNEYNLPGAALGAQLLSGLSQQPLTNRQVKSGYSNPLELSKFLMSQTFEPSMDVIEQINKGRAAMSPAMRRLDNLRGTAQSGPLNYPQVGYPGNFFTFRPSLKARESYEKLEQGDSDARATYDAALKGREYATRKLSTTTETQRYMSDITPIYQNLNISPRLGALSQGGPFSAVNGMPNMKVAFDEFVRTGKDIERVQQSLTDANQELGTYQVKMAQVEQVTQATSNALTVFNRSLIGQQRALQDAQMRLSRYTLNNITPLQREISRLSNSMAVYQQENIVPISRAQEDWNMAMTRTSYKVADLSEKMNVAQYKFTKFTTGLMDGEQAWLDNLHEMDRYIQRLQMVEMSQKGMVESIYQSVQEGGFKAQIKPIAAFSLQQQLDMAQKRKQLAEMEYQYTVGEERYQTQKAARSRFERQEIPFEVRMRAIDKYREVLDDGQIKQYKLERLSFAQSKHARVFAEEMYAAGVAMRPMQDQMYALNQQMFHASDSATGMSMEIQRMSLNLQEAQIKGTRPFEDDLYKLGQRAYELNRQMFPKQLQVGELEKSLVLIRQYHQYYGDMIKGNISSQNREQFMNVLKQMRDMGLLTKEQFDSVNKLVKDSPDYHKKAAEQSLTWWQKAFNQIKQGFIGIFTGTTWMRIGDMVKQGMDTAFRSIGLAPGAMSNVVGAGVATTAAAYTFAPMRIAALRGAFLGLPRLAQAVVPSNTPFFGGVTRTGLPEGYDRVFTVNPRGVATQITDGEQFVRRGESRFLRAGRFINRNLYGAEWNVAMRPGYVLRMGAGGQLGGLVGGALGGPVGGVVGMLGGATAATMINPNYSIMARLLGIPANANPLSSAAINTTDRARTFLGRQVQDLIAAGRAAREAPTTTGRIFTVGSDGVATATRETEAAAVRAAGNFKELAKGIDLAFRSHKSYNLAVEGLQSLVAKPWMKPIKIPFDFVMERGSAIGRLFGFGTEATEGASLLSRVMRGGIFRIAGRILLPLQIITSGADAAFGQGRRQRAGIGGLVGAGVGAVVGSAFFGVGAAPGAAFGGLIGSLVGQFWIEIKRAIHRFFSPRLLAATLMAPLTGGFSLFIHLLQSFGEKVPEKVGYAIGHSLRAAALAIATGGKYIIGAGVKLALAIQTFIMNLPENLWKLITDGDFRKRMWENSKAIGEAVVDAIGNIFTTIWDKLKDIGGGIGGFFKGIWKGVSGHAGGIDNVPRNDYLANLHQGEAVLPYAEAQRWRQGKAGLGSYAVGSIAAVAKTDGAIDRVEETSQKKRTAVTAEHSKKRARAEKSSKDSVLRSVKTADAKLLDHEADTAQKQVDRQKKHLDNQSKRANDGFGLTNDVIKNWTSKINDKIDTTRGRLKGLNTDLGDLGSGAGGGSKSSSPWDQIRGSEKDSAKDTRHWLKIQKQVINKNDEQLAAWFQRTGKALLDDPDNQDVKRLRTFITTEQNRRDQMDTLRRQERYERNVRKHGKRQYAGGLDNVPDDGFEAVLHKGEMVLNVGEAQRWRKRIRGNKEAEDVEDTHEKKLLQQQKKYQDDSRDTEDRHTDERKKTRQDLRDDEERRVKKHYDNVVQSTKDYYTKHNDTENHGQQTIFSTVDKWLTKTHKRINATARSMGVSAPGEDAQAAHGINSQHLIKGKGDSKGYLIRVGEEDDEVIIPLAQHRRDRAVSLVKQTMGLLGPHRFANGGKTMSGTKMLPEIWKAAAPFFHQDPKSPMPRTSFVDQREIAGNDGVAYPSTLGWAEPKARLARSVAAQLRYGDLKGLDTVLHEWAHLFQSKDTATNANLREGGAELFATRIARRVGKALNKNLGTEFDTPNNPTRNLADYRYKDLTNAAMKLGPDWLYKGQFGFAGGGLTKDFQIGASASRVNSTPPEDNTPRVRRRPQYYGGVGGGLQPNARKIAQMVEDRWGPLTIGGWRPPDGYDEHSTGRALDIMVGNSRQSKRSLKMGTEIANWILHNAQQFALNWVIWRQRINSADGRGWRGMSNRGNDTANHFDHVHAFFDDQKIHGRISESTMSVRGSDGAGGGADTATLTFGIKDLPKLPKSLLKSPLGRVYYRALRKLRRNMIDQAGSGDGGSTPDSGGSTGSVRALPGGWFRMGATIDPTHGQSAYNDHNNMSFAELLVAGRNAGLKSQAAYRIMGIREDPSYPYGMPMGTKLLAKMPGSKRAFPMWKNDVGSGQGGNPHYKIDLHPGIANALGWHPNQDILVKRAANGGFAWGGWHAKGADFTATSPVLVGVGEKGAEDVKITPKSVADMKNKKFQEYWEKLLRYLDKFDLGSIRESLKTISKGFAKEGDSFKPTVNMGLNEALKFNKLPGKVNVSTAKLPKWLRDTPGIGDTLDEGEQDALQGLFGKHVSSEERRRFKRLRKMFPDANVSGLDFMDDLRQSMSKYRQADNAFNRSLGSDKYFGTAVPGMADDTLRSERARAARLGKGYVADAAQRGIDPALSKLAQTPRPITDTRSFLGDDRIAWALGNLHGGLQVGLHPGAQGFRGKIKGQQSDTPSTTSKSKSTGTTKATASSRTNWANDTRRTGRQGDEQVRATKAVAAEVKKGATATAAAATRSGRNTAAAVGRALKNTIEGRQLSELRSIDNKLSKEGPIWNKINATNSRLHHIEDELDKEGPLWNKINATNSRLHDIQDKLDKEGPLWNKINATNSRLHDLQEKLDSEGPLWRKLQATNSRLGHIEDLLDTDGTIRKGIRHTNELLGTDGPIENRIERGTNVKLGDIRDHLDKLRDGFRKLHPGKGFAGGLRRVPADNYEALLHQDEMVLTAAQANIYRSGGVTVGQTDTRRMEELLVELKDAVMSSKPDITVVNQAQGAKLQSSISRRSWSR